MMSQPTPPAILILTSECGYPGVPHAGGVIIWNTLRSLSERHDVSMVAFEREGDGAKMAAAGGVLREYRGVPAFRGWLSRLARVPLLLVLPYEIVSVLSFSFLSRMRAVCRSTSPDIVQMEFFGMGIYLFAVPAGTVTVLHLHDVQSDVEAQRLKRSHGFRKLVRAWQLALTAMWEPCLCRRASLVLVLSEKDREFLLDRWRIDPAKVHLFSAFVDFSLEALPPGGGDGRTLLFVGAMHREVNREGCEWFLERVWPRIRAERPDAVFRIVGGGQPPRDFLARWAAEPGVELAGYVPDLAAEYRRASIVVVPLLRAGGVIFKLLDAFAAGRAVVATPVANSGIRADGSALRVVETPDAFAAAVLELMRSEPARRILGDGGRNFVGRRYRWDDAMGNLERAYRQALERARAAK